MDRALLAVTARALPRDRWASFCVTPQTLLRWHRELVKRKWTYSSKRTGRPPLVPNIRELMCRMARENPRRGVREDPRRASRARHACGRNDDPEHPSPLRPRARSPKERPELVGVPARSGYGDPRLRLLHGGDRLHEDAVRLVFIEIGTRRVHVTGAATNPDGAFVTQQARNLGFDREDVMTPVRYLLRDRDQKFSRSFDEVFKTEGAKVILTPVRSPKANAFAERWVRTVRAELLDWTLVLGRRHLDHLLDAYVCHYNAHRPHRGLDLAPPKAAFRHSSAGRTEDVRRRDVLNGLIHEYHANEEGPGVKVGQPARITFPLSE